MPKALPKRVVASRSGKFKQKSKVLSAIKKPTPVETRTARKKAGLLLLLLLLVVVVVVVVGGGGGVVVIVVDCCC